MSKRRLWLLSSQTRPAMAAGALIATLAVLELSPPAPTGSPPPDTVAVLATGCGAAAACAATATTRRSEVARFCAEITWLVLQTTVCPLGAQAQPVPPEPRATKLMPAGSTSVTVMLPLVGALPLLRTARL